MPLQIEILSKTEVEAIWKNRARAENFAEYLSFICAREVGDSFRITPDKGDNKNAESVRSIRHNFNEAAKERTTGEGDAVKLAPVILRWKVDSHTEKRKINKDGKPIEVEVKLVDRLTALLVASTDATRTNRAPTTEIVVIANPPAGAVEGATLLLADGRTAKLGKNGKWRAPKITATPAPAEDKDVSANGSVAETPAETEKIETAA